MNRCNLGNFKRMKVMPSIRYAIGDAGGIISYDEMLAFAQRNGFDAIDEAKKHSAAAYESRHDKYVSHCRAAVVIYILYCICFIFNHHRHTLYVCLLTHVEYLG